MRDISTFIALNRFGLGAPTTNLDGIADDPRSWLRSQIRPDIPVPRSLAGFRSSTEIYTEIHSARLEGPEQLKQVVRAARRQDLRPEIISRARHMIATEQPFYERMVLFWSNHFTVSTTKRLVGPAIPAFEREVIRPNVFGHFADMLKAVIGHPSMIGYLDNMGSVGENSRVGKRRRARKGNQKTLNENLAREILELHTLGVSGGYVQADVVELAKAISGWSHGGIRRRREKLPVQGGFEFKKIFHEPGSKTVLGQTYRQNGVKEGLAVLDDLAAHPSTARFIATKLVRHFVADNPPIEAVEEIANVFRSSNGDLAVISRALIELTQVWRDPLPKVKTPYELVISTHRAVGNLRPRQADLFQPLRELGHTPFTAPSPAGWGDQAEDWLSPEALMRRIEWIRRYAATLPPTMQPDRFLDHTIGPVVSDSTHEWVSRAPAGDAALALILASPEFQRR